MFVWLLSLVSSVFTGIEISDVTFFFLCKSENLVLEEYILGDFSIWEFEFLINIIINLSTFLFSHSEYVSIVQYHRLWLSYNRHKISKLLALTMLVKLAQRKRPSTEKVFIWQAKIFAETINKEYNFLDIWIHYPLLIFQNITLSSTGMYFFRSNYKLYW